MASTSKSTTTTNGSGPASDARATMTAAATAASALQTLPDAETAGVVTSAVRGLPDEQTADVVTAAVRTMSEDAKGELMERLAPDQAMTNDIWRWIVRTFAIVLVLATISLVAAVFVSFWRKIDTAMIQIVLTVFTTTAGILAGFVSGRMSSTRRA